VFFQLVKQKGPWSLAGGALKKGPATARSNYLQKKKKRVNRREKKNRGKETLHVPWVKQQANFMKRFGKGSTPST